MSKLASSFPRRGALAAAAVLALTVPLTSSTTADAAGRAARTTVIPYDTFDAPYTLADYLARWSNPYGPGEMGVSDTRDFSGGHFDIHAVPFQTGADFSVFDHIKYLAISQQAFAVPEIGSVTFSIDIAAETPGTETGRVIEGTYGPPGSYPNGAPWSAVALEGQQAGATLHMIDFATGQLFDWFVSGTRAFTLIERLPSSVTGSGIPAGRNQMYTQIIDEVEIEPGPHTVAIRYSRNRQGDEVRYFLDGRLISKANDIGIPLDQQHARYSGIYPSLGPGERVKDQIGPLVIGHGLFSLLDAFPFQHPEAPELSVSIPIAHRLFGQGASARFDNVIVTIEDKTNP